MDLRTWLSNVVGFGSSTSRTDAAPRFPVSADQLIDHGRPWVRHRDGGASVLNELTGLGGVGDKGAAGRPNPYVLPLSLWELRALHAYNGIARRIVDILPARACRRGWTVPGMAAEDSRLRTAEHVEDAMRWARLYGDSILVPVTIDDVPPEFRRNPAAWLRQPLELERVGGVKSLQVFDALEATPSRWDRDPASPTFRLPSEWRISVDGYWTVLHASRAVLFRGAKRPPSDIRGVSSQTNLPDDSCMQAIWDEVRRLSETLNGGAVMAQELRESVLKLSVLAEKNTSDDAGALQEQLALIQQGRGLLNMTLIGSDDDFQSRSNPPTGFSELSAGAWEAVAAVTGIPQVILMGSTPGGLNTDGASSWEGFRQLCSSYQEANRHDLEQLYRILYAAQDGPGGGVAPEGWALTFAALDEPDESTLSETRARVAETDKLYVDLGVYTAAEVARSRFGTSGWNLDLDPVTIPEQVATDAKPYQDVGLPALTAAGIIGSATARKLLGLDETAAPTPAEQAALLLASGAAPAAPPAPRTDAAPDSCVVLIPAADPRLRARVEAAIGQPLTVEDEPHVTVLYLGTGLSPEAVAEVVEVVGEAVAEVDPTAVLAWPTVRAFPPGPNGTPIVLEYGDACAAKELNECLLRSLAHLIAARQLPYRPHLTLGYAPEPVGPEALAALLGIDTMVDDSGDTAALRMRVPIGQVLVKVGADVVLSTYAGSPPPELPEPAAPEGKTRVRGHLRTLRGQGPQETEPA